MRELKVEDVRNIIREELQKNKSSLDQIKQYIQEASNINLNAIDHAYIERKYVKYCSMLWLQEVTKYLEEVSKDDIKQHTVVQEIISKTSNIQHINQISGDLAKLQYYDLLLKHYKLIDKEKEKVILSDFKAQCFGQLIMCNDTARIEVTFLEALLEFLNSFEKQNSIFERLCLPQFCSGNILIDELLKIVINLETNAYGEALSTLQDAAKCLRTQEHFLLLDKMKETITDYITPVNIHKCQVNNRSIIEIKGRRIIIDDILLQVENQLTNTEDNISEVHFVGSESIHIHGNLQNSTWHGKNIVIYTNIIKVHNTVTWDISGENVVHIYQDNAGTGKDGHGKSGADGYAGESGGNVSIFAKVIENPENWTIISNGGNGGNGQDGGNGNEGLNGKGISKTQFHSKFPSVVKFACSRGTRAENVEKMVKTIESLGKSKKNAKFDNNVFIEVETDDGNEITFSYCSGSFTTRYQAFLLYGGSLGKPGGDCGKGGLGGQGGYQGEINVCDPIVKVKSCSGKNGENGKNGEYGSHGINGWDMSYIDYQHWRDTIYYGTDERSKLTIEYYSGDNAEGTRIWCPYYDKYAEIKVRSMESKKQKKYAEAQKTTENRSLQKQALAVKKMAIIPTSFTDNYSQYCNRTNDILQNLKIHLDQTKCSVLQIIHENENKKNTQKISIDIITKRCSPHVNKDDKKMTRPFQEPVQTFKKTNTKSNNTLIKTLNSSKSLNDWSIVKNMEVVLLELKQLFIIFELIKNKKKTNKLDKNQIQSIEENLIQKYKFAILQEIAMQLPTYQSISIDQISLPENIVKYLIVTKEEINKDVSHNILGTLNQYIFNDDEEQRQKICRFCKENLYNDNNEIFKYSIKAFILESKDVKQINSDIEKYRNEYLKYLQQKEYNLNIFVKVITKEVKRNNELYDLWLECTVNKSQENIFEERIKQDKFLSTLYERFKIQLKQEYDWSSCYANKHVLNEHNKYLKEKGLMAISYRELLAYAFDINIKIYKRDKGNKFLLLYDHNRSSKRSVYLLQKYNEYMQLEVDKNYLQLNEEYKRKNNLYTSILQSIESFTQRKQFDTYLKDQTFLSSVTIHSGKLEQSLYDESNLNEKKYIDQIISYFPDKTEQLQMKQCLEKITYQYIGQPGLLYCIARRFLNESRHVSVQVLYYLVNSILNYFLVNEEESTIFHWIITSYSQKNWMSELIFLQLEAYFKKPLIEQFKWKEHLLQIDENVLMLLKTKLNRDKSISIQCIDDVLYLLSSIPNEVEILQTLGLSEWPYFLKEQYWLSKLSKLINWEENEELLTASYYVLSVENSFGTKVMETFLEIMQTKKQTLTPKNLIYILYNFYNENWELNQKVLSSFSNCNLTDWIQAMENEVKLTDCFKERNILQLIPLIADNSHTSSRISDMLPTSKEYIINASTGYSTIIDKAICEFTENDIKKWTDNLNKYVHDTFNEHINIGATDTVITNVINKAVYELTKSTLNYLKSNNYLKYKQQYIKERYTEVLAVVDKAIELKKGFKLRDTQKLSILTLLMNEKNTLEQVSTGEGKSLIVVTVSIIKALCGEMIDIITSSSVLAKRDAEENKSIYKLFNINVSHNCDETSEKRKESYCNNQIVYGDLSSFQRDYLLDRFYKKNILGSRTFDNIIVDEVDSMLLDKGNNMLYLSHELTGLDKLESVYIYIWQWINKPSGSFEDFCHAFDPNVIKEEVLYDLYGFVNEKDIKELDPSLKKEEVDILWGCLVDANILDNRGRLLKENISIDQIKEILPARFNSYINRLHYLLSECIDRTRLINVPNYLKPFIEEHLEAWINSARVAFLMQERYDYIVDIDRTATSSDRNPQIIILDRDTGTDQTNSQWDEALHQFLQLKHGCKLSLQSLKAVFISNVSYLKLYRNLYGLSGTLGSYGERNLLEDIYKVDFVIVPTARPKQFYEMKPIICDSKEEWTHEICSMAKKFTEEKLRSVLIICETVKDVEKLYKAFGGKVMENIHTYVRDYEEFHIAKGDKQMEQKQIIIATNLAGRGTDIKITRALDEAGGLHVCLTYLPNNTRIEQQAFGRAARSGNKGSGQLIIISPEEKQIIRLKKQRNVDELCRISRIKDHYENQTLIEESYFSKFKDQYEQLDRHLNKSEVSNELKKILLQSCLDRWAFWLDRNCKHIKNTSEKKNEEELEESIDNFITELQSKNKEDWSAWVAEHPYHMLKLGVYFAQTKEYDKAIDLFNKIIKQEPNFSEAARYYKAFANGKRINWEKREEYEKEIKEFAKELQIVSKCLEIRQEVCISAGSIIQKIKEGNNEGIIKIEAYAEQQKNVSSLLYMFSKSIDDIFGHSVTPEHFVSYNINESLAEILYEDMIKMGIIQKPKVVKNIPEVPLKKIGKDFNIPFEKLNIVLDNFKGKEINEQLFIKKLKEDIVLPCRETFWKLLIKDKVLINEFIYVLFNKEKLKNVDPSLLDKLLEKNANKNEESLIQSDNKRQIFLYPEQVKSNTSDIVFEKNDIKNMLGNEKYHTLKMKGTLSFNKVAYIDAEKVESITFPCYDSITINDFNKTNIAAEDAEKILAELLSKKVLANDKTMSNTYRLIVQYKEIEELKLSFSPVYENDIKVLLFTCFAYRIAIQRMIKCEDLTQNHNLLTLRLVIKPHKSLFCSLLEEGIIEPAKVATECKDIESKLKKKYCKEISEIDIMHILKQSNLIPVEVCNTQLWNNLIEKKWISSTYAIFKDGLLQFTNTYGINILPEAQKVESIISTYSINSLHEAREPLDSMYKDIEKTLCIIMDAQLQLSKDDIISNIVLTLEYFRSSLKTLDTPDLNLKPLFEANEKEFANIEEIRIFLLNGFDQLLILEEKKWTRKMLLKSTLVIVIGICQITIGILIELYSAGVCTHLGSAFINEGFSDIMFAANSLRSGYFSWSDYKNHKIQSLMIAFVTFGVGAYMSRGVKLSPFGHKVAGLAPQVNQLKVAEVAGTGLINIASKTATNIVSINLTKEVLKRISLKVLEGIAYGIANAAIDTLLQNYINSFCDSLTFTVLSDIEKKVEEHGVSSKLRESYRILGKEKAQKMINDLTTIMSKEKSYTEELISIASRVSSGIIQGVIIATDKMNKANISTSNSLLSMSVNTISKIIVWTERAAHISRIVFITDEYLNKIEEKIQNKLNDKKLLNSPEKIQTTEEEYKKFESEIINTWKALLRDKAGKIIAQHIVDPVIKGLSKQMIGIIGKMIKVTYQKFKEDRLFKEFRKLQNNYQNKLRDISELNESEKSEIKRYIKQEYDENLIQLMAKTKNPLLFAAIVEEGVPMESLCLKSCVKVIPNVLRKQGISSKSFTINLEGECGIEQSFSSHEETNGQTINLKLIDRHFTLCESGFDTSNDSENDRSRNNCLFEALRRVIPELNNVTPQEFRQLIANHIRNDPGIKYILSQGWHRFPLAFNLFGGDRQYTKKLTSSELKEKIKDGTFKFSQSSVATHTKEERMHIGELSKEINEKKWQGNPIRVVEMGEENYVTLDHRRVLAVAIADDPNLEMEMAVYHLEDEFSTENDNNLQQENLNTGKTYKRTAEGLLKKRVRSNSLDETDISGFTADKLRVRVVKSDYPYAKDAEKRLGNLGFQMGGPKRNKHVRSKSVDKYYKNI